VNSCVAMRSTSATPTRCCAARPSWALRSRILTIPALVVGLAACTESREELGRELLSTYGCVSCHQIPGAVGLQGWVGPSLEGWRERRYIAGRLLNTPDELVRWIVDPPAISPGTAMPNLGVREGEAGLMTAYLFTLE
jgi:cytochrome c